MAKVLAIRKDQNNNNLTKNFISALVLKTKWYTIALAKVYKICCRQYTTITENLVRSKESV